MLFSSIVFLYCFLPIVAVLYAAAPQKLKNGVLLLASLVFYAWGEKQLVLMLMATILVGWLLALFIEKRRGTPAAKWLCILSVAIDLAALGYYKYTDFFIQSLNRLPGVSLPLLHIALPIGISFYTFQILSYTVDVYRGTVPAQKNPITFAAYVALFPQLIAGPIVRYADIEAQLQSRTHTLDKTAEGVNRFLVGLGKKVLIANTMGEVCAQFRAAAQPSVLYYWLYAVAFMLQIYYDFSGYSDMAIGLGKMFGFRFMENFDYPYISASVTEFWRRWHISLGSWFRDYVYIPLGGNRRGAKRQLFNILVVWMLTGLWHGAAVNFVLWGLFYALLLMLEKLWLLPWLNRHKAVGHVYTLLMVLFGFVLFNAQSTAGALQDVAGMLGLTGVPLVSNEAVYYLLSNGPMLLLAAVGCTPVAPKAAERLWGPDANIPALRLLCPVLGAAVLVLVTASLVDGSFNPFLYFRF